MPSPSLPLHNLPLIVILPFRRLRLMVLIQTQAMSIIMMRYIIRHIICGLFHHLFFCPKNPLLASFSSLLTSDNQFICDKQFPPHGQVVTVLHLDQQFCSPPRCIFEYRGTIQYSNFGPYKIEYTFVNLNIRIFNITWAAKIKYGGYSDLAVPDPQELKYFTLIFGTYFITSIQIFS